MKYFFKYEPDRKSRKKIRRSKVNLKARDVNIKRTTSASFVPVPPYSSRWGREGGGGL